VKYHVLCGEASEVLRKFPANSFHSLVTDPPGGIGFMGKEWDRDHGGRDAWVRLHTSVFAQAFHVLKPGAYGVVWAIPRTSHWTAYALENAGFTIRDRVHHIFGSGMPHSRDASKAIDEHLGVPSFLRPVVGEYRVAGNAGVSTEDKGGTYGVGVGTAPAKTLFRTKGASDQAKAWDGWQTNLKPSCEDWWLIQKPPSGTLAENLLEHCVGAINVDATRVPRDFTERGEAWARSGVSAQPSADKIAAPPGQGMILHPDGGWPSNFTMTHSEGCSDIACAEDCPVKHVGAEARYFNVFYAGKASTKEREAGCEGLPVRSAGDMTGRKEGSAGLSNPNAGTGRGGRRHNPHPTVKNLALMRHLVKLVTPKNGIVLDPFCGSGSTGIAAILESAEFLGIDQDPESCTIARARLAHWETK